MYNKLQVLLILPLFSISVYATDLNNTEAILTQASEATQPIQAELDAILKEEHPPKEVISKVPVPKETLAVETNITAETPTTETPTIEETATVESPIIEKSVVDKSIIENQPNESNISIQEKTVEQNETIQKEINTTTITENNISLATSPTQEDNESEKKEKVSLTKGNSLKGKHIFIQYLKETCNTTAYKFAGNYAQEEWEEIAESGKFKETIFKLCPSIKETYKESWSSNLYQFFYEHANDSENIPEC